MAEKPYCYIDLNAGRGVDDTGQDGSPLLFLEQARLGNFDNYIAHCYEIEAGNAHSLNHHISERRYPNAVVHCQDHHVLLHAMLPLAKWQYGIAYADPSNAAPCWDVLKAITLRAPQVDLLINLAAASFKRQIERPQYVHLDAHLFALKKYWFVRKGETAFQWTVLLGTDYAKYPEAKAHGYSRVDSAEGQAELQRLVFTHKELSEGAQLELF